MRTLNFLVVLLLAVGVEFTAEAQVPAFPGADGYGRYATGGRGGSVYYVTTLDDGDTYGTLRYGVTKLSKVTILFKVSGTIHLNSGLNISQSNITIAGQSAPGDGICIAGYPVSVSGSNVIIRYLRFRMGDYSLTADEADGADAFGGRFCDNVIIDHCSISWSTDECASFYANTNFTMQWCIISESLRMSLHSKGAHGYGAIWGGLGASYYHNLMIHHGSRTPRFGTGNFGDPADHITDMRNNVIYNWAGNGCYGAEGMTINMINNYYKPGPATTSSSKNRFISVDAATSSDGTTSIWGKYYLSGNYNTKYTNINTNNWDGVVINTTSLTNGVVGKADIKSTEIQGNIPLLHQHTAQDCYPLVVKYAGCSLRRDSIDLRLADECYNGTYTFTGSKSGISGLIDTLDDLWPEWADETWIPWPELASKTAAVDSDVDGIDDNWEEYNGLDFTDPTDGNKRNSQGYTMLEVYLNSLVADITTAQYAGAEEVGLAGEPYDPNAKSTDMYVTWSMESGVAGEAATVSKEGVMATSTYYTESEINNYSTRTTYSNKYTTFQPTIEYKSATMADNAIVFEIETAEGVTFFPTELSLSAIRYGTSGGWLHITWIDAEGTETTLATGIHATGSSGEESAMTTTVDMTDVTIKGTSGKCQLVIYVYKLSPTKELGLADIKIGGHVGYTAAIGDVKADAEAGDVRIFNINGQQLNTPQKGFNIINGKKQIIK